MNKLDMLVPPDAIAFLEEKKHKDDVKVLCMKMLDVFDTAYRVGMSFNEMMRILMNKFAPERNWHKDQIFAQAVVATMLIWERKNNVDYKW